MTGLLRPLDVVRIPAGLPEEGVPAGSRAVILDVYVSHYFAYEVEVVDREGRTLFTGAVEPERIELEVDLDKSDR
ncbi:DUF4926 domain-containing protein [Kribbella sp. NPDC051620]|uniref:DUF4926 domain-containing protein n=1 Tax=Kribbella sp. NPDC051620 TaxID=3364120 RepID=UPI0037B4C09E